MHIIYGLQDPRDHMFFYVGMTEDVFKRFIKHIQCDGSNYKKNAKVTEMRGQNVLPLMVELERTEITGTARVRESYWINHFITLGHPITNIARSTPKLIGKVLVSDKRGPSIKRAIKDAEEGIKRSKKYDDIEGSILKLYQSGKKRKDIQEMLDLNGDEYWMVKAVCDAYDRSPNGGR